TRQPAPTAAVALARPSPRLEPVTIATLSRSPRSMWPALNGTISVRASRQVVDRPVKGLVFDLELIPREELPLGAEQLGFDKRHNRAFDGASVGERRGRGAGIGRDEAIRAPREDGADGQPVTAAIDLDALRAIDAFSGDLRQLTREHTCREGLAPQTSAPDRSAAKRQIQPRILNPGE